ncbi:MAG: hypothetical protein AAFX45_00895 [Pseudomonadota bacterium]
MDPVPAQIPSADSAIERLVGWLMIKTSDATLNWSFADRRRLFARLMAHAWGPMLGWPGAISQTLTLVRPDLDPAARRRLARRAARHAGEGLAELLCPKDFAQVLRNTPIKGPGVAAMKTAAKADRGVLLVTAGLGHPDALMAALALRGLPVARQSPPSTQSLLDHRIAAARAALGGVHLPAGAAGAQAFEAHIAKGGFGVIRADDPDTAGTPVRLFGARVRAPRLPAAIALRHHAELIPAFALKRPNGRYGIWMAASIAHARPDEMLQAFQDSLESVVAGYMDQFFWAEPRWQPERYLSCAAPSTGP